MKTLVLAAMMVTMLTISATPALASASQLSHQIDMNHRPYPYVTDGILFQGNIGIDCRLPDRIVKKYENTKPPNPRIKNELEDAAYTLRKCRAAGYPASDNSDRGNPTSDSGRKSLPDTGGFDLLALTAGGLLVAGGLLYRKFSL